MVKSCVDKMPDSLFKIHFSEQVYCFISCKCKLIHQKVDFVLIVLSLTIVIIQFTHSSVKQSSALMRYFLSLVQSLFIIFRDSLLGNVRALKSLSLASTLRPPLYQYYKKIRRLKNTEIAKFPK